MTIGGLCAESYSKSNFMYQIIADIEEVCEMMGIVLFIYTLHSYWIKFSNPPATAGFCRKSFFTKTNG